MLYGADNKKDWSKITDFGALPPAQDWTTYLDMDSAVDYYITREFTKDNDADFYRSNFFYIDDVRPESTAKFFMGPIWDFDRSAGANTSSGTSNSRPTGWWIRGNGSPNHDTNKIHWFTRIAKDPRFLNKLHDRWAVVRGEMQATFVGDGTGRGPAVSRRSPSSVARTTMRSASGWQPTTAPPGRDPDRASTHGRPRTPVSSSGSAPGTRTASTGWTPSSRRRRHPSRSETPATRAERGLRTSGGPVQHVRPDMS